MTLRPDSPAADEYRIGLAVAKAKARLRKDPPHAVVLHTTGAGPVKRVTDPEWADWRARWPAYAADPFDATVWIYTIASPDSGHFVVGQDGRCTQVVPERLVARHVGSAESEAYSNPLAYWCKGDLRWWAERWPGMNSPIELAGGQLWRGGSCNGASIGIEVAPPIEDPRGPWSNHCWATLVALVSDICLRHEIPCDRTHVVTHSDAHPIARTAKGQPWDPPPSQFTWAEFARSAGAPF